jgi:hypothetical protein
MTARGFPHSDTSGSSLLSSYPELFAAWYVLHRLWSQGIHLVLLYIFDVNCTRNNYGNKLLRAASCVIQHMKVLLYAVFKDLAADRFVMPRARSTIFLKTLLECDCDLTLGNPWFPQS